MYSDVQFLEYPDWYKLEKETRTTIRKLTKINELSFYLSNSDEYIRRLAILRIEELKLKEAIEPLKNILEDETESSQNKELVAYAIKSISCKWDIDIFFSNKYLNKNNVKNNHNIPNIQFIFPEIQYNNINFCLSTDILGVDIDSDYYRKMQETNFEPPSCYKECLKIWQENFLYALKLCIFQIPKHFKSFIVNLYNKFLMCIKNNLYNSLKKIKNNSKKKKETDLNGFKHVSKSTESESLLSRQQNFSYYYSTQKNKAIINFLENILVFLFSPIRLIIRNRRKFALLIFAAVLLLIFTPSGNRISDKYFHIDISNFRTFVVQKSLEIANTAYFEIKYLFNTEKYNKSTHALINSNTNQLTENNLIEYEVIYKSGLNLRKSPSENAEKAINGVLPYGTKVKYLNKQEIDSKGKTWLYVKTQDGTCGWAYSRGLSKN